jgi:peroxiredoxin
MAQLRQKWLLFCASIASLLILGVGRLQAEDDPWKVLHVMQLNGAKKAEGFDLVNVQGDGTTLEDYKGKVILLTFWASYCPPCVQEMPALNALYLKWKDAGLSVVGISVDEDRKKIEAFLQKVNIAFPILWDSKLEAGRNYRVYAIPMTYLIDREGNLVGAAMGARPWNSDEAHALVASLLND